jgi:capsid protein
MIRNGLKSRSQVVRELGGDPDALMEEIAKDNATADKLGLVFDSDPRKTTAAGQEQIQPAEAGDAGGNPKPGGKKQQSVLLEQIQSLTPTK